MVHRILERCATRQSPQAELPALEARGSARAQNGAAYRVVDDADHQASDEQRRERNRRARPAGNKVADLIATLALPFFVLGLVAHRLSFSVTGARRRDRSYRGVRYDALSSDKEWSSYAKAEAHAWDLRRHRSDRET